MIKTGSFFFVVKKAIQTLLEWEHGNRWQIIRNNSRNKHPLLISLEQSCLSRRVLGWVGWYNDIRSVKKIMFQISQMPYLFSLYVNERSSYFYLAITSILWRHIRLPQQRVKTNYQTISSSVWYVIQYCYYGYKHVTCIT